MNILHEEFSVEKSLQNVPYAVLLWFIMAIIHTLNRVLEKPILVDIDVQIAVVHRKKSIVFGKI